jgi:hypothetical protein
MAVHSGALAICLPNRTTKFEEKTEEVNKFCLHNTNSNAGEAPYFFARFCHKITETLINIILTTLRNRHTII